MSKVMRFRGMLSFLILHELSKHERSGDELAIVIGKRKGSILTPGTIYPTLKRLKKAKLLSWKRDGRKKYYSLTKQGQEELKLTYQDLKTYFKGVKKYF